MLEWRYLVAYRNGNAWVEPDPWRFPVYRCIWGVLAGQVWWGWN